MNCSASDTSVSVNAGNEKHVLWVETYNFKLQSYTIANMKENFDCISKERKPKYYDFWIKFQFRRIGEKRFTLTCLRTPVGLQMDNCLLQFHCYLNVLDQEPIILVLNSVQSEVSHTYDLNACVLSDLEVQVSIKMIEYSCETSQEYKQHEEILREMRLLSLFKNKQVLNNLSYILQTTKVQDIFIGHQNLRCIRKKCKYIKRTAFYSNQIIEYMKAKGAFTAVPPSIDLDVILKYIFKREHQKAEDMDLFKVYYEAHQMGLNFLIDLSRDAILNRIDNEEFSFRALMVADVVDDTTLFGKLLEHVNMQILPGVECDSILWQFMLRNLVRHFRKKNLIAATVEPSQASSSK